MGSRFSGPSAPQCTDGYKGRVGIYEVMPVTEEIGGSSWRAAARCDCRAGGAEGVWNLRQSGLNKVRNGMTSLEKSTASPWIDSQAGELTARRRDRHAWLKQLQASSSPSSGRARTARQSHQGSGASPRTRRSCVPICAGRALRRRQIRKERHLLKSDGKVKGEDIALFSRQLSTMLTAGIPMVQAFEIIGVGHDKPAMQKLVLAIKSDIETGNALNVALRKHPLYFNDLYVNLIEAGEHAGALETVLDKIATYQEKTEALKKIKKALFYPAAVLAVAIIVTVILLLFVIPQFESLFQGFGADLPAFTRSGHRHVALDAGPRLVAADHGCRSRLCHRLLLQAVAADAAVDRQDVARHPGAWPDPAQGGDRALRAYARRCSAPACRWWRR